VEEAKDLIITGGFDVHPAEVERALMSYPAIRDCVVVGLPDEMWGERVTAVLELHPGLTVSESEVRNYVKSRLGGVKTPKQVKVWDDLPRSTVGTVLKNEVRARLLNELGDGGRGR
jgi:fatty-acyl-CoA synthase